MGDTSQGRARRGCSPPDVGARCSVLFGPTPLLFDLSSVPDRSSSPNKKPPGRVGTGGCGRTLCGVRRQVRRRLEVGVPYMVPTMVTALAGNVKVRRAGPVRPGPLSR